MSREKIQDSPLARSKLVLGAAPPQAAPPQEEAPPAPRQSVKAPEHKSAARSGQKRRTTIYIPEELAIRLDIYIARHKRQIKGGISGLFSQQMEKLLAEEE
jgi:hypothetical protein